MRTRLEYNAYMLRWYYKHRKVVLARQKLWFAMHPGVKAKRDRAYNQKNPERLAFWHMKQRCENPKDISYHNYGARGIKVYLISHRDIIEAIGHKPSPIHQIDRIDNNGHYTKENIRWVTKSLQMKNRRSNGRLK